jgi:hypothetical protein
MKSGGIDASEGAGVKLGRGSRFGPYSPDHPEAGSEAMDFHRVAREPAGALAGEFSRWYNLHHMRRSTPEC